MSRNYCCKQFLFFSSTAIKEPLDPFSDQLFPVPAVLGVCKCQHTQETLNCRSRSLPSCQALCSPSIVMLCYVKILSKGAWSNLPNCLFFFFLKALFILYTVILSCPPVTSQPKLWHDSSLLMKLVSKYHSGSQCRRTVLSFILQCSIHVPLLGLTGCLGF